MAARRNRRAAGAGGTAGAAITDDPSASGALALDPLAPVLPMTGPHDGEELDPEVTDAVGLVDFGSIRLPVPANGTVTVEPTANGRMQAVHIALAGGRLSVSALAAPKSQKLWPDLVREIDKSLRDGGARVRSYSGEWGRELHATSGKAKSVFIGVDGPRWMLYGVATGPGPQADALEVELRRMLRGTVVVRGRNPYPVRTVLPLVVPEHLAEEVAAAAAKKKAAEELKAAQKAAIEQTAARQAAQQTGAQPGAGPAAAQMPAAQMPAVQVPAAQQTGAQPVAPHETGAHPGVARSGPVHPGVPQPGVPASGAQRITPPIRTGAQRPVTPAAAAAAPVDDDRDPPTTPLREQIPSARQTAAGAWRPRPGPMPSAAANGVVPNGVVPNGVVPNGVVPNGVVPQPVASVDPVERGDLDDPTEVWDALPPGPPAPGSEPSTTAAGTDVRGSWPDAGAAGGRRSPVESMNVPPAEPTGRRHLVDPAVRSTGRHPLAPAAGQAPVPPGVDGTGARGPIQRAADESGGRAATEPGRGDGRGTGTGGWRPAEPVQATGHAPLVGGPEATGRRRLPEPQGTGRYMVTPGPADNPATTTGRRPVEPARPAAETPSWAPAADPAAGGAGRQLSGTGVDATSSPFPSPGADAAGARPGADGLLPIGGTGWWRTVDPGGEPGAEGTGRRRLVEPAADRADEDVPGRVSAGEPSVEGNGRRRRADLIGPDVDATGQRGAAVPGGDRADAPVDATRRRRLGEPADAVAAHEARPPVDGTAWRALAAPTPEVSGWMPVIERTRGRPVEGTGRRRHAVPDGTPSGEPAVENDGWRRRPEPPRTNGEIPAAADAAATARRHLAETPVDSPPPTAAWPVVPATGTGAWLAQPSDRIAAEQGETNGRRHLADAPEPASGGRRRLREPNGGSVGAEPVGAEPVGAGSAARASGQPLSEPAGEFLAERAAGPVDSTGRRHRVEPPGRSPVASPVTAPGGSPASGAEPRTGRRRAADSAQLGMRRTLGAEYLIDTGEQAAWTGGARRYPLPAEPLSGAPGSSEGARSGSYNASSGSAAPGPSDGAAAGTAAEPASDQGARRPSRHSAGDDGENAAAATVRLRALIGEPDPDRPSGRHRRSS